MRLMGAYLELVRGLCASKGLKGRDVEADVN